MQHYANLARRSHSEHLEYLHPLQGTVSKRNEVLSHMEGGRSFKHAGSTMTVNSWQKIVTSGKILADGDFHPPVLQ